MLPPSTSPDSVESSPAASRSSRLLPEPRSPTTPTTAPSGAAPEKPLRGGQFTLRNSIINPKPYPLEYPLTFLPVLLAVFLAFFFAGASPPSAQQIQSALQLR